jgi:superoxide dismutase, Cu-Zn family
MTCKSVGVTVDPITGAVQTIGTARILAARDGIKIEVKVSQLSPGLHGVHVHNVGKCEGPDFVSAGPHLNSYTKKHGKDNPDGPHAGDLLNIEVNADGTAIAIHAKQDDYKTDPAGNSGP